MQWGMAIMVTKEEKNYKIEERYNLYKVKLRNSKKRQSNKNNCKSKLQLNPIVYVNLMKK